tara:strand:+ start:2571 stop:2918 length:348 start_codon:yes stop_codon:yes gene_type:complete
MVKRFRPAKMFKRVSKGVNRGVKKVEHGLHQVSKVSGDIEHIAKKVGDIANNPLVEAAAFAVAPEIVGPILAIGGAARLAQSTAHGVKKTADAGSDGLLKAKKQVADARAGVTFH